MRRQIGNGLSNPVLERLVHDMRGPVRAIADLPGWMKEDLEARGLALPSESLRMMGLMAENAAHIDAILSGLSRLAAAGREATGPVGAIDPAPILRDLPVPAKATLSVDMGKGCIRVRPDDLRDVVNEALRNAVRFHPQGAPVVSVKSRWRGVSDWELSIADDGPGIPAPLAPHVFKPFVRSPVDGRPPGAGLGLAVIDRITRRYGGSARVCAGQGAKLVLSFRDAADWPR